MRHSAVLWIAIAACGDSASVPPAPPPAPAATPEPPLPAGRLTAPSQATAGERIIVMWSLSGRNGCYRQTPVTTSLSDHTITHAYQTAYEGEICTMALVPGGFEVPLTLPEPGTWTGRVQVDGVQRATYTIDVTAP